MEEEGRTHHFLAAVPSTLALPSITRPGCTEVWHVVAFSASPQVTREFPLLIGASLAESLWAEFEHQDIEAVLQHVDGQVNYEDSVEECPACWNIPRFGPEDAWRLVEAAHLEPMPGGESVRLLIELPNFSAGIISLSAVGAQRLKNAIDLYFITFDDPPSRAAAK